MALSSYFADVQAGQAGVAITPQGGLKRSVAHHFAMNHALPFVSQS
jgi:hypothetical protein